MFAIINSSSNLYLTCAQFASHLPDEHVKGRGVRRRQIQAVALFTNVKISSIPTVSSFWPLDSILDIYGLNMIFVSCLSGRILGGLGAFFRCTN
jgi:hypothetical protein